MNRKNKQTKSSAVRAYGVMRFILIPVVLLVMAFSAYKLIGIAVEYSKSITAYKEVSDTFLLPARPAALNAPVSITIQSGTTAPEDPMQPYQTGEAGSPGATMQPEPAVQEPIMQPTATPISEFAPIAVDFDRLIMMNGDAVCWIYIPDTAISYPVMQADNNSKYLSILPNGEANKSGSIFMDFRNDPQLSDRNTILYGHNMNSGAMFAALSKFKNRSFFGTHPVGYLLTPSGDYKITFLACATVPSTGDSYELFETDEDLQAYLQDTLQAAHVKISFDPAAIERIVTLSTCSERGNTRTILIGMPERLS